MCCDAPAILCLAAIFLKPQGVTNSSSSGTTCWRWWVLIQLHTERVGLTAVAMKLRGFYSFEPVAGHPQDSLSLHGRCIVSREQKWMDQDLFVRYNSQKHLTLMRLALLSRRNRPNPRTLQCPLLPAELLLPQPSSSVSRREVQLAAADRG